MRKNAADRKDSDPRGGVPELKITGQEEQGVNQAPVSPGRPILKVDFWSFLIYFLGIYLSVYFVLYWLALRNM